VLSLYLFALLVGGGLLAASLFGGHGHGHDTDAGLGDSDAGHDHDGAHFLSLRTLTYLMFVFGGVGSALTLTPGPKSNWLILATATMTGLGVAAAVGASFKYLRQTDSGSRNAEESFVGLTGRMVVPIQSGGVGKVQVVRGDRTFELLARPLNDSAMPSVEWRSVIVVEMSRGTALVMPLDEAALDSGA
jgi:MFS family permease